MRKGGGVLILRMHPDRLLQRGAWDLQDETTLEDRLEEDVDTILDNFDALIDFLRVIRNTEFADLDAFVQRDNASPLTMTKREIVGLVRLLASGCCARIVHGHPLALLDMLFIVSKCLLTVIEDGGVPHEMTVTHNDVGPSELEFTDFAEIEIENLIEIDRQVLDCFESGEILPSSFRLGDKSISLPMVLLALAKALDEYAKGGILPSTIRVENSFQKQEWIDRSLMKFPYMWKWPVLPKGFSAPEYVIFAKSQFFWCMRPFLLLENEY